MNFASLIATKMTASNTVPVDDTPGSTVKDDINDILDDTKKKLRNARDAVRDKLDDLGDAIRDRYDEVADAVTYDMSNKGFFQQRALENFLWENGES